MIKLILVLIVIVIGFYFFIPVIQCKEPHMLSSGEYYSVYEEPKAKTIFQKNIDDFTSQMFKTIPKCI